MILLRLYPRAWRERYEAEMLALLEDHDVTLATRLDLLRGAFEAWQSQWQDHRRSVMAPRPTVARRAAGLGVIPSAVIIATFMLGLVLRSPLLVNMFGVAAWPALFVVGLWAGMRAATGDSTWRDRLGAGLVAGASAGLVAGAVQIVVIVGLTLAQVVFGLWVSPLGPPSVVVAGRLQPVTVATWAANVADVTFLLPMAAGVPAASIFGAAAGAIGAALNAIPPRHPGQRPTAS